MQLNGEYTLEDLQRILREQITKEDFLKDFTRADGRLNNQKIRHIKQECIETLIRLTPQYPISPEISNTLRFKALVEDNPDPHCRTCGKFIARLNDKGKIARWCDQKCWTKSTEFMEAIKKRDNSQANIRREETMLAKYGVRFNQQRKELSGLNKTTQWKGREDVLAKLEDRDLMVDLHHTRKMSASKIAEFLGGCYYGTVIDYLDNHNIERFNYRNDSIPEGRVESFLKENSFEYTKNSRSIIPPLEVDFFIPLKNLAVEVNGIYWHSEVSGGRDRKYHLNKMLSCKEAGVELIQIYDAEIIRSEEKIFSLIRSKLGITPTKIHARKCRISDEISKEEEKMFFNENHRQGYVPSQMRVGLFDIDDKLVSLMSFRKPRYNSKNFDWELLRFASRLNTQVIGGASRLFARRPEGSIVSYSDNRFGTGGFYLNLGFEFATIGEPSYHYTKNHADLFHRSNFMKKNLVNKLDNFDPELSEWDNMRANGWDRIWDSGNSTWIIK